MHVDALFVREGFTRSHANHSLYIKQTNEYLLIVVDDLMIMTNTINKMNEVKAMLKSECDMSNFGELHYYFRTEFQQQWNPCTITMSQSKYIEEVLKQFNMEGCKPIGIPFDMHLKLVKLMDEEYEGVKVEM